MSEKVVIIGQGIRRATAGYARGRSWLQRHRNRSGRSPGQADRNATSYVEDVTSAQLAAALESGRYSAASDYAAAEGFDICVIAVPTPLRDGAPDLGYVEEAGRALATYVTSGCTVILESTTYPGTTEDILGPLLEDGSGLNAASDFFLGYSPERIDPGNPRWHLGNTPKVISGVNAASLDRVQDFYSRIVDATVPVSSPRIAELTKLLENTFRHVNIALVNELAMFANQMGIDVWEAIDAAATKPFGFQRFAPGPGVGGHCLPIDPSYLSWQVKKILGRNFRFVELANDINDHMPEHIVHRIIQGLNARSKSVKGSRILLLGLAYKKNVGDVRESPAIEVVPWAVQARGRCRSCRPIRRHIPVAARSESCGVD